MISVVIPTYKNKEAFINKLDKNLLYLSGCEVIVVNDDPTESIQKDLEKYKHLKLIENVKNIGFGESVNKGIAYSTGDYILLLNNDVILKDKSYSSTIEQFKNNPELFAISFAQIEKDNTVIGKNTFYWKDGFFYHKKASNLLFGFNGWAEGGSCLLDKKKFNELKGFDPLYSPFYVEDIDLSYKAWKAGYKVVFDPNIIVEHHHSSTIGKYIDPQYKDMISGRNHFIFIWKNISDKKLILVHILLLPYNLLYFIYKKDRALIKGFFAALLKLPKIIQVRSKQKILINDSKVFEFLRK